MALVESSHYTAEEGLRQQVGQYSAPPQVRLQRSGYTRLAVAFIAALGAGVALFYAVTLSPAGGDRQASVTLMGPDYDWVNSGNSHVNSEQMASAQSLNASRQLALLAGGVLSPSTEPWTGSQVGPRPGPELGLAPGLDTGTGVQTGPGLSVVDLNRTVEAPGLRITPARETHEGPEADLETVVVERRVPLPKHKPAGSFSDPSLEKQFADAAPVAAPEPASGSEPGPGLQKAAATGQVAGSARTTGNVSSHAAGRPVVPLSPGTPALNPAPWVRITERSTNGLIPITGPDGETSRIYYARPFPENETRPRISIVIGGLGLSQKATAAAIDQLPPEVTLAFAPYGKDLQTSINRARSRGHEVLLELPMEPFDYPTNDPGPFTLLTNNNAVQNSQRLGWLLAQFNGYVGVTNYLGAKFTSTPQALMPVLRELDERGLLMLDDGTSSRSLVASLSRKMHVPHRTASRTVDLRVSRAAIDDVLLELENIARGQNSAVGMGYAYPVTIDRILLWANTLEQKGLVLAPISANIQGSEKDTDFDQHASSSEPL